MYVWIYLCICRRSELKVLMFPRTVLRNGRIVYVCMYECNVQLPMCMSGLDSANPVRICLGIPITSKGTKMDEIRDSPFWNNLFDSFMKSVDWRSNRYVFRFYLGLALNSLLYAWHGASTYINTYVRTYIHTYIHTYTHNRFRSEFVCVYT